MGIGLRQRIQVPIKGLPLLQVELMVVTTELMGALAGMRGLGGLKLSAKMAPSA